MKILSTMLVAFCCIGCYSRVSHTNILSFAPATAIVLNPIDVVVNESDGLVKNPREIGSIPTLASKRLTQALFINPQKGWARTSEFLFKTVDGGVTWSPLPFEAGDSSEISSFVFVNESHGWLAVTKRVYNERYGLGNSSLIFATNDDGHIWSKQTDLPDEIKISRIEFWNTNNGYAIGSHVVDPPRSQGPPYDEILVLRTTDGGEVWTDISESVRTELQTESGTRSDFGSSIHLLSATDALLLTRAGRVMQTKDQGKTWKILVKFQDERPNGMVSSIGYRKLVFDPAQRFSLIAGATGDEGYWGDLVVNGDDTPWTSYELRLIPIDDAIFLSKDEVIACGIDLRSRGNDNRTSGSGVILHSLDRGKTWTVIYQSKTAEEFISLTKVNESEFYAVSDTGTLLKFGL